MVGQGYAAVTMAPEPPFQIPAPKDLSPRVSKVRAANFFMSELLFQSSTYGLPMGGDGRKEGRESSKLKKETTNERKEKNKTPIHTTSIWADFWACPFKSWLPTSFFCDMDFLDEIQATQNISNIIQPPNFCWEKKRGMNSIK